MGKFSNARIDAIEAFIFPIPDIHKSISCFCILPFIKETFLKQNLIYSLIYQKLSHTQSELQKTVLSIYFALSRSDG